MRKLILSIITLLPLFVIAPAVSAHFPATSGTINAELHIDPDDSPVSGKPQTLNFIISDSSNKFRVASCACELAIIKNGQPSYFSPVTPPQSSNKTIYSTADIPYTFSTAGSYQISLSGQPVISGEFKPFALNWNIDVPAAPETGTFSVSTFIKYFVVILLTFSIIGITVFMLS